MKDYTVAVNELRDHYNALSVFKAGVKAQVKAEYEAKMDLEIKTRVAEEEIKFANHLAAVKEREQMPLTVIQDNVLRTRTWKRWEYWRDMAGIEPERVTASDARKVRELASAPLVWNEDYTVLTIKRAPDGTTLPEPVSLAATNIFLLTPRQWYMEGVDDENVRLNMHYARQYRPGWMTMIDEEIARQHEAGNLVDLPAKS